MSANPLFANKKRDSSLFYSTGRAHVNPSFSTAEAHGSGYDRSKYPPPKRYRTTHNTEDPFGDNEDFTADDLEEIDILASQAYTQDTETTYAHKSDIRGKSLSNNGSVYAVNTTAHQSVPSRQGKGGLESSENKDTFGLEVLHAKHEELKHKLKELQGEVFVKNGEIKVLRDALHQTESDLEQQRISHMLLEKEKSHIQSEREKELSRKMQSLQSELQFKDAEMNELKTKLKNCERSNRIAGPVVSPKKSPSRALKSEASSSPQSRRSSFPTKESFNADMNLKPPTSISHSTQTPPIMAGNEALQTTVKQVKRFTSLYLTQRKNNQGSVLLNALMQQPVCPGSLGLCHLLSSSPEGFPGSPVHSSHTSNTNGTSSSSALSSPRCSALRDAQQLAITGLNSIALGEYVSQNRDAQSQRGVLHLNKMSWIPGAVHLLPLVEYHFTAYCQTLQTLEKSGVGLSENQAMSSSSPEQSVMSCVEDALTGLIEPTLASLRILYHLVFYSLEVVTTLLQSTTPTSETEQESRTVRPTETTCDEQTLYPLFKKLLLPLCSIAGTLQKDAVRHQILRVLVKLAENSPNELLSRFQSLFTKRALLQCLSLESPLSVAHMSVRLLAVLSDQQILSGLICSCSESCILLALYTYVITRPDKIASESLWLKMEHEVIRFLTKLTVQGWNSLPNASGVICQCKREVIKAVVLMLQQEWLGIRRLIHLPPSGAQIKAVQFLRDAVLLLYSLSQKDKNFTEHCLEVLHQYDQAVPAVRQVFRKFNVLKENEEFALDELFPPEVETEDEYMDCT
ncbi:ATR-interacting protein [Rhinophrynus dorsalis]